MAITHKVKDFPPHSVEHYFTWELDNELLTFTLALDLNPASDGIATNIGIALESCSESGFSKVSSFAWDLQDTDNISSSLSQILGGIEAAIAKAKRDHKQSRQDYVPEAEAVSISIKKAIRDNRDPYLTYALRQAFPSEATEVEEEK